MQAPGRDTQGGRRPLGSFRTLKTIVWHRLDAPLTETWSYFGALVPAEKSDLDTPGLIFGPPGRPCPGVYSRSRSGTS